MDLLGSILHFAFPEPCISCGGGADLDGWPLCEDCRLPRVSPKDMGAGPLVSRVWSLAPYSGPMGALVRRAKYRPDAYLMRRLAGLMADSLPVLPAVDAVVHVPTSSVRQLQRGFDQAGVLAAATASKLQVPHAGILRRADQTEQAGRGRAARMCGLSFRFTVRGVVPKSVLLVDDVRTSGATLDACALALLGGGARNVQAVVLASNG
jgi:ComF family protein